MSTSIKNPAALVEEFKKSGEFDRLRRELLTQFQHDDAFPDFKRRIEETAKQRLLNDEMLQYMPPDVVQKELGQEIDRFPIVERWVKDAKMFSDQTFVPNIRSAIQKIVKDSNGSICSDGVKENTSIPEIRTISGSNGQQDVDRSSADDSTNSGTLVPTRQFPVYTSTTAISQALTTLHNEDLVERSVESDRMKGIDQSLPIVPKESSVGIDAQLDTCGLTAGERTQKSDSRVSERPEGSDALQAPNTQYPMNITS